ncbi:hypothetical protein GOODEAATRI_026380, partial [Goodea atripinnis]
SSADMEQTFIAVKPDGVQRGLCGEIIKRFEHRGFKLVAAKFVQVTGSDSIMEQKLKLDPDEESVTENWVHLLIQELVEPPPAVDFCLTWTVSHIVVEEFWSTRPSVLA